MSPLSSASNWLFKTAVSIKEKVSSPLSGQILEFCESELFPAETLRNSEVVSTSNYEDQSSYTTTNTNTNLSLFPDPPPPIDEDDHNNYYNYNNNNATDDFSNIIFEDEEITTTENDINLDFTITSDLNNGLHHQYSSNYQFGHQEEDQFDLTLLQFPLTTDDLQPYPHPHPTDHVVPVMGGPAALPPTTLIISHEDDCLSAAAANSMPPSKLMRFNNNNNPIAAIPNNNNSFMDHPASINSYLSSNPPALEIFNGNNNFFLGNEINQPHHQLGDHIFCPDPLPPPNYNSNNELQALSNDSQQHVVNGGGSCATPLASEITTSLEPETFRVTNKLTTEERKEKIHRYMKKRNERNFSKKIKYACRKTLADSRPRVRGRFAKNDEFGENNIRTTCSNHEEDTDEDVKSFHVVVKEEEDKFESSDIFAHISGLNSFKCNYPAIQSWI